MDNFSMARHIKCSTRKTAFITIVLLLMSAAMPLFALEYTKDFGENVISESAHRKLVFSYTYTPDLLFGYEDNQDSSNKDMSKRTENSSGQSTRIETSTNNVVHVHIKNLIGQVRKYKVQLQPGKHSLYWYPAIVGDIVSVDILAYGSFTQEIGVFDFDIDNEEITNEVVVGGETASHISTASLEDILKWNVNLATATENEDFFLFRWQTYPDVLIFSFTSREVQSKYLKRLAFFAEKTETRGTVPHLKDIANRAGWGAHDYKPADLAEFFNIVSHSKEENIDPIILTPEELAIRDILVHTGTIKEIGNTEQGERLFAINEDNPHAAIVSFARSDSDYLQEVLLFHELLHTFYFRDEPLRAEMSRIWNTFSPRNKEIWNAFMYQNGYDSSYEYLVKNELFAYLLQRPLSDLEWYVPGRILPEAEKRLPSRISAAEQNVFTNAFIASAQVLVSYLEDNYQVYDGSVKYVYEY